MTDQNIELREHVNNLTRDHRTPVYQGQTLIRYRPDPPLLETLRQAKTANIGAGTGGTLAHERSTSNIAALELYTAIQKRVREWALAAAVPRHWALNAGPVDWTNPQQLLTAWHLRVLADTRFDERPYNATLHGWINAITDLCIDPPRRWTLAAPCPLCNQRWVLDPEGHQIDALGVVERDPADRSTTVCRNCAAVWNGITGARELRIAIDDAAGAASYGGAA